MWAVDEETGAWFFNEDKSFGETASLESRFKLKPSVYAFENKVLGAKRALAARVHHILQTQIPPQFVICGGVEHRQPDLDFEFPLPCLQDRGKGLRNEGVLRLLEFHAKLLRLRVIF